MIRIRPLRRPRGFSLVEILLAIFILGIGIISVAAVFPAGIALQRQSNDDTLGPMVAKHAMGVLRSRLRQEDFGSFSDWNPSWPLSPANQPYFVGPLEGNQIKPIGLVQGDWPWMRPGFVLDNPATSVDEGAIDIFSLVYTRAAFGLQPLPGTQQHSSQLLASEIPNGVPGYGNLRGIPFNRERFEINIQAVPNHWMRTKPEPLVMFTQGERSWPMKSVGGSILPQSQYHWECMFRRFQGRVWVAVFVYRVGFPGGQPRAYSVAPGNASVADDNCPVAPNRSPLPVIFHGPGWKAGVVGGQPPAAIPGTVPPVSASDAQRQAFFTNLATRPSFMWQSPGQWLLDQNNMVHRVLVGRRNIMEGPVQFARPIPAVPASWVYGVSSGTFPASDGIATAWYLPTRDANGATLTPVYILVEEL
jgi:prepilin-type N-terminal cleavage/methylation domain-containing protein